MILLVWINGCAGMSHIYKKDKPKFVIQAGFEDNYLTVSSTNDLVKGKDTLSASYTSDDNIAENVTTAPSISILSSIKDLWAYSLLGKGATWAESEASTEEKDEVSNTLFVGFGGRFVGSQRILDRSFQMDNTTTIRKMQFDTIETSGELLFGFFSGSAPLLAFGYRLGIVKYNLTIFDADTYNITVNERDKIIPYPTSVFTAYIDATMLLYPIITTFPDFFDSVFQNIILLYSIEDQWLNISYAKATSDETGSLDLYRHTSALSIVYVF